MIKYGNILNKELLLVYDEILTDGIWTFVEEEFLFDNENNEIKEYNKLRRSSNLDLPLDTLIEFRALTLTSSCVIEKDGKYYPEIYLDEGLYMKNY